jgi:hypothetical protein
VCQQTSTTTNQQAQHIILCSCVSSLRPTPEHTADKARGRTPCPEPSARIPGSTSSPGSLRTRSRCGQVARDPSQNKQRPMQGHAHDHCRLVSRLFSAPRQASATSCRARHSAKQAMRHDENATTHGNPRPLRLGGRAMAEGLRARATALLPITLHPAGTNARQPRDCLLVHSCGPLPPRSTDCCCRLSTARLEQTNTRALPRPRLRRVEYRSGRGARTASPRETGRQAQVR